jgi:hypothetical protein
MTTPNKNEYSPWMGITWASDALLIQQNRFSSNDTYTTTTTTTTTSKRLSPDQYETYTDFVLTGLASIVFCGGKYDIPIDDDDDNDEDDEETLVSVRPNVQYSYNHRPYEIIGETINESCVSNIHKYGFVSSEHGIRVGEEIVVQCEIKAEETNVGSRKDKANDINSTLFIGYDIEWLQRNGVCVDNFIIKESLNNIGNNYNNNRSNNNNNIHNRGAFAKRSFNEWCRWVRFV